MCVCYAAAYRRPSWLYNNGFLFYSLAKYAIIFMFTIRRDLMDELLNYIREAVDRKQENGRRRRRKDVLRLQLVRVLEKIAENKTFAVR